MSAVTPPMPKLYLTSRDAGWDGLLAEAFHEPEELEGWISPASEDASLILFSGGSMWLERRPLNGGWRGSALGHADLLLRAAGGPHEVRWKALSPAPTRTLHLSIGPDVLARTAEEAGLAGVPAPLARERCRDPLLAEIGFALWRELESGAPAGRLYAQTASRLLAVHLLRHHTAAGRVVIEEPAGRLTPRQAARVVGFVLDHLADDVTLGALAAEAGLSPYHFARLFRRTLGESPHQFVVRQRVEHAKRLLHRTDLPLVDVAAESGFASQSHLTDAFRRRVGTTPRRYRRARS